MPQCCCEHWGSKTSRERQRPVSERDMKPVRQFSIVSGERTVHVNSSLKDYHVFDNEYTPQQTSFKLFKLFLIKLNPTA